MSFPTESRLGMSVKMSDYDGILMSSSSHCLHQQPIKEKMNSSTDRKSKLIFIDALFTGGVLFSLVMRCYVIIMEGHKKMIYTQLIIRLDTDQRDSLASILEA